MKSAKNLLRKGRLMLPQVALIATLVSCSKQDLQENSLQNDATAVQVQQESLALLSSNSRILYDETFEGTLWSGIDISQQWGTSYGFQVASTPVFAGSKSGRFELRDTDPEVSSGTRSEIKFPEATNMNRWYAFSAYFPSADYQYDSKAEIINQWHQGGGVSPSIALQTRYDRFLLETRTTPDVKTKTDLGAITKDKWLNFVIHIKHSNGSDGLIEIWQNGVKILTRNGGNSYKGSEFDNPKWKLGIYKDDWNGSETTDTKKRVIYYDNIRLGNENATYSDMTSVASSSTIVTPTPTEPAPTEPAPTEPAPSYPAGSEIPSNESTTGTISNGSFTLVDANLDRDVKTIANGETISLSARGLSKLNFRANISAASVKVEISGPVNRSYVDDAAPFALFGDDNSGNYYYGGYNPLPAGTYTLKATPYSDHDATNIAGTPVSVTFTIAK